MPETPNPKLTRRLDPPTEVAAGGPDYAELDVATNFSFLRGASHPDELVFTSAMLGQRAMAVTDVNTLAGVVRAHAAAKQVKGFRLIIGARLQLTDAPDLLVWATDRAAYGRLCRLLTLGKRRTEKGECLLSLQDFLNHSEGMLAARDPGSHPHGRDARVTAGAPVTRASRPCVSLSVSRHPVETVLSQLRDALGDRISLAACCPYGSDDVGALHELGELSRITHVPLVATNHVHYHDAARRALQDVLACVRHGCTIREAGFRLFPNGERHL
jgi:error-prone DNA polymerase